MIENDDLTLSPKQPRYIAVYLHPILIVIPKMIPTTKAQFPLTAAAAPVMSFIVLNKKRVVGTKDAGVPLVGMAKQIQ